MRASFLSEAKSEALQASAGCVPKHPWFGEEAVLRPRGALVPSQGYVFVSADYSQVMHCGTLTACSVFLDLLSCLPIY